MRKNHVKLGLSVLTVVATPIAVNEVASHDVHAEYRDSIFYNNNKPANWWYNDGTGWYFFQNGKKFTGYGKDNAGAHNFVNGKYAEEKKVSTTGYVNGVYYVNGKVANWWYDDGKDWFFFQNGKKFTGYGKDNAGTHHFVNGKYAEEKKVPTTGYVNGVYYVNGKPANWWYDDGKDWFFFQNGKKFTGYGKDNAGAHNFVNGKYAEEKKVPTTGYVNGVYYINGKVANWWYDDGTDWFFFQNGKKFTGYGKDNAGAHNFVNGKYAEEKKAPTRGYDNGVYYVDGKPANWWYDDGTDWFFFQNGKKFTGYGKDNAGTHNFVNGKYVNVKEENKNTKRAIFLDPGHGGSDSGAVANGVREKDLTLSVYNKVSSRLASLGYSVLTSRNTDKDVGLVSRADQANKSNADMFLSIHFNAGGRGSSYGIETYYYKDRPEYTPAINKDKHNDSERLEKSKKLAQKIQQSLVSKTGAFDRGVKRETFAVLRETSIPSILVELGFIDNQEEVKKIKTNEYQEKLADGIVDGIVEYYK